MKNKQNTRKYVKSIGQLRKMLLGIMFFLSFAITAKGQEPLSVAERNALQGFNDTIDRLADDFVEAYLVVAEPGDFLYSAFGHAALHMKCPSFGLDYYFTMESEGIENYLLRYLAGDLKMGLFYIPAKDFLSEYAKEHRGIKEWKLNLTPLQKQRLWMILDRHVKEWQHIPYDYYNHGCAITIVNILNELVGTEAIHYSKEWPTNLHGTIRETGYYALKGRGEWAKFWICVLVGNEIDKVLPNEQLLFVPTDLAEAWRKATINGVPILAPEAIDTLPSGGMKKETWCTPLFVSIVLVLLALLSVGTLFTKQKWAYTCGTIIDYTILGIVTVIGVFMTYLLFFSALPCTDWNWLYIAFNPLPAVFWHWRRYWALPYIIVLLIWIIAMLCAPHILVLSSHLLIICALIIILIKQKLTKNEETDF